MPEVRPRGRPGSGGRVQYSGFRVWVSGSRFRFFGPGFRTSGFWFRFLIPSLQISGCGMTVPGFEFRLSCFGFQGLGLEFGHTFHSSISQLNASISIPRTNTSTSRGRGGRVPSPQHFCLRLTDLPGQWLQCQANGSKVCRVFRGGGGGGGLGVIHELPTTYGVTRGPQ